MPSLLMHPKPDSVHTTAPCTPGHFLPVSNYRHAPTYALASVTLALPCCCRFFHLNPGKGAMLNRGDLLCVAGDWEPIKHPMAWFWPGVVAVVALTAAGAQLVAAKRTARQAAPAAHPTEGKEDA